ncbi:MAG: transcription elongation factor GreA [Bacteroidales bacterium]|nr:transcription elongation factor GreA [Bacteroidales bacterium]
MAKVNYYTAEGLKRLKEELTRLTSIERPLISKQIAEARDKGDLTENAEYDAAKDAQGMLEMKISKLEEIISNARIIDESKISTSKAMILSIVTIKNTKNRKTMQYTLVSENEADLKTGKIAINSPIGKALLGRKVGDKVEVDAPAGKIKFEIVKISK